MTHLIISKADIVVSIFIVHHRSNKIVIIVISNRGQSNCKVFVFLIAWPFRLTSSWCSIPCDLKSYMSRDNYERKYTFSIDKRKQTSSYGTQPSGQNPDQFIGVSSKNSIIYYKLYLFVTYYNNMCYCFTYEKSQVCESK